MLRIFMCIDPVDVFSDKPENWTSVKVLFEETVHVG
jgi:hypothetical protein